MTSTAVLVALLLAQRTEAPLAQSSMQVDVDRLVRVAQDLTGVWPTQAPPAIPEVALVARYGTSVTPLLLALLSDDPHVERDRARWKVQQQAALALCRIFSESHHCGRTYCDGDPPERIARVKDGWLRVIASITSCGPFPAGNCSIASTRRRCSRDSSRSAKRWLPEAIAMRSLNSRCG